MARHGTTWLAGLVVTVTQAQQIQFVNYETLVENPHEQFSQICKYLGLPADVSVIDFERPARTSVTRYDNAKDRVDRWRRQLSTLDQRLITDWLDRIAQFGQFGQFGQIS